MDEKTRLSWIDEMVAYLNSMACNEEFYESMKDIFSLRFKCEETMRNHPTIKVKEEQDGTLTVGLMDLLSGLLGASKDAYKMIWEPADE